MTYERSINRDLHFGALCWNQYTDWPSLLDAGLRAERAGFYSLWTWDHLYPIVGSDKGPMFEGYLTLAAWAQATSRVRVGLMVGANPFRNPALTAKMATTLDHISGGRAYLGIGGAWNEHEARAFGIEFGESPGERLRWLREALPVMRGMLHGEEASAAGPHYFVDGVRNDPRPVQRHMPLLVGGGGEKVTLRLVARYGDACNIGFAAGLDAFKRKEAALRRHCEELGRPYDEIEKTALLELDLRPGRMSSRDAVTLLRSQADEGIEHAIVNMPNAHEMEPLRRIGREVIPA
ncbi:MAG TPA: LLM class flavin-dependent oxidoreductase, partial [Actinomycetota bacterium]|nr:LLM class flavin-dependent oxidoreductase [Actinomycetota bacterium]